MLAHKKKLSIYLKLMQKIFLFFLQRQEDHIWFLSNKSVNSNILKICQDLLCKFRIWKIKSQLLTNQFFIKTIDFVSDEPNFLFLAERIDLSARLESILFKIEPMNIIQ